MFKSLAQEKRSRTNIWFKNRFKPDWTNTIQGSIGFCIVFLLTWEYRGIIEANAMILPLIGGILGIFVSYIFIWLVYFYFALPRQIWKEKNELKEKVRLRNFGEGFYKMLTQYIDEGREIINGVTNLNVDEFKRKHSDWCVGICGLMDELKLDHTWKDRFMNNNPSDPAHLVSIMANNSPLSAFSEEKSEKQKLLDAISRHILNLDHMRQEIRKYILKTYEVS